MSDYDLIVNTIMGEGFSSKIAINTSIMVALNVAEEVKFDDLLLHSDTFTKRLEEKFHKIMWELSDEEFKLCHSLWKVHHSYETSQSLQGLGGCEAKTYRQLIKEL